MTQDDITREVARHFPTFGGNQPVNNNPITAAFSGRRPTFALGVEVDAVVRFVLLLASKEPRA